MKRFSRKKLALVLGIALISASAYAESDHAQQQNDAVDHHMTATPIKHVILIIGENRTFDQVFGTFVPPNGQTVWNLLSKGIVDANGSPGPNYVNAMQWMANDTGHYTIHPVKTSPYQTLGPVTVTGAPSKAPFATVSAAMAVEPALPANAYELLTIGGTGLPSGSKIDTRFPETLVNGPYDINQYVSANDYTGSPVHRFFQMWQEEDCDIKYASPSNPSGCLDDLWPWVEATTGAGSNGASQPADYAQPGQHEGPVAMGFYTDPSDGDGYFKKLADEYAIGDNFHQSVMGGTGANHVEIGFGTALFYANKNGNPAKPPENQIENPDPQPGTNNFYSQDGYSGGSYVECSDMKQPGVAPIRNYLDSLPYRPFRGGDCRPHAYYLVNNYNPGYLGTGQPAPLGPDKFTVPPSTQQNLGLLLSRNHISWHYYGEGWNNGKETGENVTYCNICNPFLYSKQIMTNPRLRANLKGIRAFYSDIRDGALPAVSIVKPDGYLDGHPASSKWELFEAFTRKIVDAIKDNPKLWKNTAIIITTDEGGGYYDSGYIEPIDFFGDGTRIPLIVVSPYSKGVGVVHTYGDQVSFDKFVEANWGIGTISSRSRDNLPNPVAAPGNPYVPTNAPAIGNLMSMFSFPEDRNKSE